MQLGRAPQASTRRLTAVTATPARLGALLRPRLVRHVCHTAASDEKSRSHPQYLSDLIAFESEAEEDVSAAAASLTDGSQDIGSSSSSSSRDGSSLASSLGLSGTSSDPTQRAQDIISRATEVLAAARAALGTPEAAAAAADQVNSSSSSNVPQPAAVPPPGSSNGGGSTSSSSSSSRQSMMASNSPGPSPAGSLSDASPTSSMSGSSSSSGGGGGGGGEQLTRRWSQLSEGQDLTRHVLQNALDQMQKSGTPIAAPDDAGSSSSSSSSSSSGGSGARFSSSSPGSSRAGSGSSRGGGSGYGSSPAAAAAAAGGAGRSSSSSRLLDRDLRKGGSSSSAGDGHGPAPGWAQSLLGADDFGSGSSDYAPGRQFPSEEFTPQLKPQALAAAAAPAAAAVAFADDLAFPAIRLPPAALSFVSQSALDAEKARRAVLPPLQSVLELTTAFRPPERTGAAPAAAAAEVDAAAAAAAPVGKALADGSGRLADGTWWEKKSGIEYGKNGYWKRWQLLKGGSEDGSVEWNECWWEASDYTGLKELGAEKNGRGADGAAWRESWTERLMYASNDLDCVVERNAHKWAVQEDGDEWEEKWGEHYHASGKVAKYADKWGKQGPNVWHERWGEDYDSSGDACVKWTDKWAERLLPGGAREQWGDKWHEAFANGRGEKNGEVWSVSAGGDRYQRWWGEHHLGDWRVRRFGHSTTGEHWDDTINMDTYYNPVPHFGFKLALQHSPQLRNVPLKPKPIDEANPFGPGLDQL